MLDNSARLSPYRSETSLNIFYEIFESKSLGGQAMILSPRILILYFLQPTVFPGHLICTFYTVSHFARSGTLLHLHIMYVHCHMYKYILATCTNRTSHVDCAVLFSYTQYKENWTMSWCLFLT